MPILHSKRRIRDYCKVHLGNFDLPVRRPNMQPRGDGSELDEVIESVPLVVVQDYHFVEELGDVFFSVEFEPVFQPVATKLRKQLLLLEEVVGLDFLIVALLV